MQLVPEPVATALGVLLAIGASLGLSLAAPPEGGAESPNASAVLPFAAVSLIDTDLGSGSPEFSGVTVNERLGRLLIVDDGDAIFEYELDGSGEVGAQPLRRIDVGAGGGDTEGIAWIEDELYAVLSENTGTVSVFDLAGGVTVAGAAQVRHQIATGITEDDGRGAEGVAFDRFRTARSATPDSVEARVFWSVKEAPTTLVRMNWDGSDLRSLAFDAGITDVSDVAVGADGTLFLLSDESRSIVHVAVDDSVTELTVLSTQSLTFGARLFNQPEGLAVLNDLSAFYVVGEGPGGGRLSFGLFRPHS